MAGHSVVDLVRDASQWFETGTEGVRPLVDAIGDARVVLIGQASHGTHELYRIRAELTQTRALRPLEL